MLTEMALLEYEHPTAEQPEVHADDALVRRHFKRRSLVILALGTPAQKSAHKIFGLKTTVSFLHGASQKDRDGRIFEPVFV